MSQHRDPITGKWTYQNNANSLLRAVLAAKHREPYVSEVVEAPLPNQEANDLLRQIVAEGGSMQSRRDDFRAVVNQAAEKASAGEDKPVSLDDLLRQIVAGPTAEEAIQ